MRLIIAILIVFVPAVAAAQNSLPTAGEATGEANADSSAEKVREMIFGDGEDVTGDLIKPNDSGVKGEVHGKTDSLINVRSTFVSEILQSTDDV